MLHVVKALQQNEQAGFAATGLTDQPDPLTGLQAKAEPVEYLWTAGITERDIV